MSEERETYKTLQDLQTTKTEMQALENLMDAINLHEGMRLWVYRIYRLKNFRYARSVISAWEEKSVKLNKTGLNHADH